MLLAQFPTDWPSVPIDAPSLMVDNEEKASAVIVTCTTVNTPMPVVAVERFGKLNHLQRVAAWVLHFLSKCRLNRKMQRAHSTPKRYRRPLKNELHV